jgi:predicted dehydrogenase
MTPIRLNRRRFLGASAAAGLALSGGVPAEGGEDTRPVRLGLIGLGNRGTSLLRTALELPGVTVAAVADAEPRHLQRARGIVEKATRQRPDGSDDPAVLLARDDLDAVLVALPCDLHAATYRAAIAAGKSLYAEKPLGLSLAECDAVIAAAAARPELAVHVGFQRRSHPRYREAVAMLHAGAIGPVVAGRGQWVSSNGPVSGHGGWLGSRARSGDWMVEQAVHVWDVLNWALGGPPERAFGSGRRDVFTHLQPDRDVTDHYAVMLLWPGDVQVSFTHSWADPADDAFTGTALQLIGRDGGLDLGSGVATFRAKERPRQALSPGSVADTKLALEAFVRAVRSPEPVPPPVTLAEARDALRTALLVRRAVDPAGPRRVVTLDEVDAPA